MPTFHTVVPVSYVDLGPEVRFEFADGVLLDFNEANQVVGIEILRVSDHVPVANLKHIRFGVA